MYNGHRQVEAGWGVFAVNCTGFRTGRLCNLHKSLGKRLLFDSCRGYLAIWQVVAPTRIPLQNRGFLVCGRRGDQDGPHKAGDVHCAS